MIVLLPTPREIRYNDANFDVKNGVQLFLQNGDDATHEVLSAALKKVELGPQKPLPEQDAATLILAADKRRANLLLRQTASALEQEIATSIVHRDGPYFPLESTRSRRMAKKLSPDANDEQYFLHIGKAGVIIRGRSRRALFWGVQTLCQIIAGSNGGVLPAVDIRDWPVQPMRGQHIDMKYFLAKPAVLSDWLRNIAALKLNTVIFEYEDKFPYEKRRYLRHDAAMSPAELKRVLETARRHHIQVIPLTQSLGHLEYALKHQELAHLREQPNIYFQLCPTNKDSLPFVREIIDEVWEYHPQAEFYHIGGDETWCLGECPRCAAIKAEHGELDLYLKHIVPLLEYVGEKGKRPILWDDMIRERAELVTSIPRDTVLGYWDYEPTREQHHPRDVSPTLREYYSLQEKPVDQWPDALSSFPFFEFYQQHGFDVLAVPCGNYGTIVTNDVHSGRNTLKFAEKSALRGGMGTINTQWAGFQTLFSNGMYSYALTAESAWSFPPADTTEFDSQFSRFVYGDDNMLLLTASRLAAEGVGFRVPGAGRPFNLLHFAVMDAELHYEGGLAERRRWGGHPHNLNFSRVLQRKLELLKTLPDRAELLARMDWVESQMKAALPLIAAATPRSRDGREMKQFLAAAARFKATRIQTMRLLMNEPSRFASPRAALKAEHSRYAEMEPIYRSTLHAANLQFELRSLFGAEIAALQELAK